MALPHENGRVSIGGEPMVSSGLAAAETVALPVSNGHNPDGVNGYAPFTPNETEFPVTNVSPFRDETYYDGLPESLQEYLLEAVKVFGKAEPDELVTLERATNRLVFIADYPRVGIKEVFYRAADEGHIRIVTNPKSASAVDRVDYMTAAILLWPDPDDLPAHPRDMDYDSVCDSRLQVLGDHPLAALFQVREGEIPQPNIAEELIESSLNGSMHSRTGDGLIGVDASERQIDLVNEVFSPNSVIEEEFQGVADSELIGILDTYRNSSPDRAGNKKLRDVKQIILTFVPGFQEADFSRLFATVLDNRRIITPTDVYGHTARGRKLRFSDAQVLGLISIAHTFTRRLEEYDTERSRFREWSEVFDETLDALGTASYVTDVVNWERGCVPLTVNELKRQKQRENAEWLLDFTNSLSSGNAEGSDNDAQSLQSGSLNRMDSTTGTIVNPYWFNEESFSGDGDFGHAPESMVSAKASINPNWLRPDTFSKSEVETPEEIDENPADSPSEADEDAVAHVFPEQHSMSVGKIGDAGDIVDWCEPNTLVQDIRRIREQQRLERGSAVRPDSKPRIIETTSTGGRRVVPQSEKKAPQRVDDKDRSTFDPAALRGNRIADKLRAKRYDEKWGWLGRDEN